MLPYLDQGWVSSVCVSVCCIIFLLCWKRHFLPSLAIRKYGRDFQAISDVIGNKSVVQVKNFFVNYRRRFNIDEVLQEWEAEHGKEENGPSNQKPVKSPDSSIKMPEEDDEVSLKQLVSAGFMLDFQLLSSLMLFSSCRSRFRLQLCQ